MPWKELLSRTTEYVRAKYLPAELPLMDPSHLRADAVIRLLDHWYARQLNRKPVLRFQQAHSPGPAGLTGQLTPAGTGSPDGGAVREHSGLIPQQRRRATVSKTAAGPGRSSQNRLFSDGSFVPGQHSPATCLPTPPDTSHRSLSPDPSVSPFQKC